MFRIVYILKCKVCNLEGKMSCVQCTMYSIYHIVSSLYCLKGQKDKWTKGQKDHRPKDQRTKGKKGKRT